MFYVLTYFLNLYSVAEVPIDSLDKCRRIIYCLTDVWLSTKHTSFTRHIAQHFDGSHTLELMSNYSLFIDLSIYHLHALHWSYFSVVSQIRQIDKQARKSQMTVGA